MYPLASHEEDDKARKDGPVIMASDAEEEDKGRHDGESDENDENEDEDDEDEDNEDSDGNEEDDGPEDDDGNEDEDGNRNDSNENNHIIEKSRTEEPKAEEVPAAPSAAIATEENHVVYFYGRNDPSRKMYQLPLEQADTWLALRRYLGAMVSGSGRLTIYDENDISIPEIFWKPHPKDGATFTYSFSNVVFVSAMSTNSTAPEYRIITLTVTYNTSVHELKRLVLWEMRRKMWKAPENIDDLKLGVFLGNRERPIIAKMAEPDLVSRYLEGRSDELKIKVRNVEAKKEGDVTWPEWNETYYWP